VNGTPTYSEIPIYDDLVTLYGDPLLVGPGPATEAQPAEAQHDEAAPVDQTQPG
jgi:hypothetical protein